jgi:hypothetical protein
LNATPNARSLSRMGYFGARTKVTNEAMRDLVRARAAAVETLRVHRQQVSALMLRHGRQFPRKTTWTKSYLRWLQEQKFDHPARAWQGPGRSTSARERLCHHTGRIKSLAQPEQRSRAWGQNNNHLYAAIRYSIAGWVGGSGLRTQHQHVGPLHEAPKVIVGP